MRKKIINYLLRKFTDYHELEEANAELSREITTLVFHPERIDAHAISLKYQLGLKSEAELWMGDLTSEPKYFEGLINSENNYFENEDKNK